MGFSWHGGGRGLDIWGTLAASIKTIGEMARVTLTNPGGKICGDKMGECRKARI